MQTHPYPSQGPGSGIETYLSPSQGEFDRGYTGRGLAALNSYLALCGFGRRVG